ncbi:TetR/AcrR family transcriptional regulator [Virgibacillus ainsalahensis]
MLEHISLTSNFRHLLLITEELIQEKGCKKTTLQDIIQNSGLSKGAIYHYVRSKDELFGLILQIKTEKTNEDFHKETKKANTGLEGPLRAIANGMKYLTDEEDVTNVIFIYLLSRKEEPAIADILSHIYEHSIHLSVSWIEAGQRAGVITDDLDAKQTAMMFMTFSYGLRVRAMIDASNMSNASQEFHELMRNKLRKP